MDADAAPPPDAPAPEAPVEAEPHTNTLAVVAFAASWVVGLAGIVCGHIALAQIKRTGEKGRGLALAATIIGYASVALTALLLTLVAVAFVTGALKGADAAAAPTTTPTTVAHGPTQKECELVAKGGADLRAALSAISPSEITEDPAQAKKDVDSATVLFENETTGVADPTLLGQMNRVEFGLAGVRIGLVNMQVQPAGQQDTSPVDRASAFTMQELDRLDTVCR